MNTFKFYKKRKFNDFINDTFSFFRVYAKNFFVNYLIINGLILLLLGVAIMMLFMKTAYSVPIGVFAGLFLLFLLFLTASYPIIYADLAEKNPLKTNFSVSEIIEKGKGIIWKVFLFSLISFFILGIPYGMITVFLMVIPLLGILIQWVFALIFSVFAFQAMFIYVKDDVPYFQALTLSFERLKIDLWDKVGATFIMNLIVGFFMGIIMVVPIFFIVAGAMGGASFDSFSVVSVLLAIMFFVLLIIVFMANNFSFFLQLIIYFTAKYEEKQIDEIDLIGQSDDNQ